MQASGEGVEIFQTHLSDGDAEFSGFIFADFACDYLTGWQAVYCQSDYAVNSAEFLRVVVKDHIVFVFGYVVPGFNPCKMGNLARLGFAPFAPLSRGKGRQGSKF